MFLPGFETGTFRVSDERDNHYTTQTHTPNFVEAAVHGIVTSPWHCRVCAESQAHPRAEHRGDTQGPQKGCSALVRCLRALGAAAARCPQRDGARPGTARGLCVHITTLLKGFKSQGLEGRTTELLHPARPLLSWEIPAHCFLLQQKDGPGRRRAWVGVGPKALLKEQAGSWRTHPQAT